jgi:Nickel responsive protein SCO4226-like
MGAKAFVKAQCSSVGRLDRAQLRKIAAKSNGVLAGLSGKVQWLDSFVAADKTFCIYLAESEDLVFEHARVGGFPVTKLTEIPHRH